MLRRYSTSAITMASAHAYQRRISVPVRHLVWVGDVCLSITTTRPGYMWAIWRIPAAEPSLPFSCRGECAHADSSPCICCPNMCLGGRADFCRRCVSVIDRGQPLRLHNCTLLHPLRDCIQLTAQPPQATHIQPTQKQHLSIGEMHPH